ncbi:MAG: PIN domain-containing protein [Chromatiales bacterium]|nr:PIN domain-containing protein [Chromatiales bacterium]
MIDASVWVAALLARDLHHREASRFLKLLVADGTTVSAPALALPEVAGAIARQTDDPGVAARAVSFLRRQDWVHVAALDDALAASAASLAAQQRLRGADAVYLALAIHDTTPLITLDAEMLKRAPEGVRVFTPGGWLAQAQG